MPAAPVTGPDLAKRVGKRLLTWRGMTGLSMQEASQRAGISQGLWSYFERGERPPSLRMLARLAAAMEVPPDVLIQDNSPLIAESSFNVAVMKALEATEDALDRVRMLSKFMEQNYHE